MNPKIIQGGMGVGVSTWSLAQAVSKFGQLGVVSGTALDQLMIRRLADGDPDGAMRRGLDAFPFTDMARRIWQEYFVPGGKPREVPYPATPMHQLRDPRKVVELCIVSNFLEVFLAKEGHDNPVGINFLEKVQTVHLPSIYGAMLAGVGYVLMGAGIPLHIPGVLDLFAHPAGPQDAEYKLSVTGAPADMDTVMRFDPADYAEGPLPVLARPRFLAIVSSNTLATTMLRRANGRVDGLILETQIAGGHNAPPRGKLQLSVIGEPVYGQRDQVNIEDLRALGVPIWLAGGYGSPEKLREALDLGAAGIQVGTAFEFADESGLRADFKQRLLALARTENATVFTDPQASPTGFPFKVARLAGTSSEPEIYSQRPRLCNLGFLREAYVAPDSRIAYRCAAEPVNAYVAKGGKLEDTIGRKCLCNALMANVGYAQLLPGQASESAAETQFEPALITAGDDLSTVARFLPQGRTHYTAADVLHSLLSLSAEPAPVQETVNA